MEFSLASLAGEEREKERRKKWRAGQPSWALTLAVPNLQRFLGLQAVCGRRTAGAWLARRSRSQLRGPPSVGSALLCSGDGRPGQTSPLSG